MKDSLAVIGFVLLIIILNVGINDHRKNQCEHNGLGKWHYWSQVCEPVGKP